MSHFYSIDKIVEQKIWIILLFHSYPCKFSTALLKVFLKNYLTLCLKKLTAEIIKWSSNAQAFWTNHWLYLNYLHKVAVNMTLKLFFSFFNNDPFYFSKLVIEFILNLDGLYCISGRWNKNMKFFRTASGGSLI